MSAQEALLELLDRIAALGGATTFIRALELAAWPEEAIIALTEAALIGKAPPASMAICPECEEHCSRSVLLPAQTGRDAPVIFCDQRGDTHAVEIPAEALVQWQTSGMAVADVLARLLGLRRSGVDKPDRGRWEIGLLRGHRHASHLVLSLDGERLVLQLNDNTIPVNELLFLHDTSLCIDKPRIVALIDGSPPTEITPNQVREPKPPDIGSPEWRSQIARKAANARHDRPGGSRDKRRKIQEIWATGKYTSRDRCAEEECAALDMSFSAARKALRNTPDPDT
jgi:hypothetical protein